MYKIPSTPNRKHTEPPLQRPNCSLFWQPSATKHTPCKQTAKIYDVIVAGKYYYHSVAMGLRRTDAQSLRISTRLIWNVRGKVRYSPVLLRPYSVTSEICCLMEQFTVLNGLCRFASTVCGLLTHSKTSYRASHCVERTMLKEIWL
jgi:hypothetical protein